MPETLRGIPVEDDWVWVIIVLQNNGRKWFTLPFTVARTRKASIDLYEAMWSEGGEYARRRRQGRARAVRCRLQPCTFGEDQRKGVSNV